MRKPGFRALKSFTQGHTAGSRGTRRRLGSACPRLWAPKLLTVLQPLRMEGHPSHRFVGNVTLGAENKHNLKRRENAQCFLVEAIIKRKNKA